MWYECIPSMAIITVALSMGNVVCWGINKFAQGNVSWTIVPSKFDMTWHTLINKLRFGYIMWCFWFGTNDAVLASGFILIKIWLTIYDFHFHSGLQPNHGRSIRPHNVCQRRMPHWRSIQSQCKDVFLFTTFIHSTNSVKLFSFQGLETIPDEAGKTK